jgi:hypothetical protein
MQKVATNIFIGASVAFGALGVSAILTSSDKGPNSELNIVLFKLMFATVFVILPSFALSVAYKYLKK